MFGYRAATGGSKTMTLLRTKDPKLPTVFCVWTAPLFFMTCSIRGKD